MAALLMAPLMYKLSLVTATLSDAVNRIVAFKPTVLPLAGSVMLTVGGEVSAVGFDDFVQFKT